jgi:hypothetical protein
VEQEQAQQQELPRKLYRSRSRDFFIALGSTFVILAFFMLFVIWNDPASTGDKHLFEKGK